jgi:hypothetical protein
VAAAVVLVLAGAVTGWLVAAKSAGRTLVLVTAREVPAGHVLIRADVRSVDLAGAEALGAFTVTETETVVGRSVMVPLVAGSLLTPRVLGAGGWPPVGQAVVSVLVKPGAGPVVQQGQQVGLVLLPNANAAEAGTGPAAGGPAAGGQQPAVVSGVVASSADAGQSQGTGSRVVSVVVAGTDAPGLAAAAATGRVALVLLPS